MPTQLTLSLNFPLPLGKLNIYLTVSFIQRVRVEQLPPHQACAKYRVTDEQ